MKNILAVCHDAGAAEIISAYVKKNPNADRWFCLVLGPAEKVFARKGLNDLLIPKPERAPSDVITSLGSLDLVLTGTSWSTSLDRDYIIAAKAVGIQTASYLDHWLNYRERFGYPTPGWEKYLPDEIWVGDAYALTMASSLNCFSTVTLAPNLYFEEMKVDIERERPALLPTKKISSKKRILFISEPVSVGAMRQYGDPRYFGFTEHDVVTDIANALISLGMSASAELVIRPHPSDPQGSYTPCQQAFAEKFAITFSNAPTLIADILAADLVIGMESMALVTAVFAGKPIVSYIPSDKKICALPFSEIVKVKDMSALRQALERHG